MRLIDLADDLKSLGMPDCDIFRRSILSRYRPIASALSHDYSATYKRLGYVEANRRLAALDKQMTIGDKSNPLSASAPDNQVKSWAEDRAHHCGMLVDSFLNGGNEISVRKPVELYVTEQGIKFPLQMKQEMTEQEERQAWLRALARVCDAKWWRRQVRKTLNRNLEIVARDIRIVSAEKGLYCSDIRLANRKRQKQRNQELLENLEAENQHGDVYTLADLADCGLANPRNRFAELITRSKGFDLVAQQLGHVGWFFTLTTPSRFHRMKKGANNCYANSQWEGATPRDAQDWLCRVWARVRAKWDREDIRCYGLRVSEPHHDGCPHWHMSLFFRPDQAEKAKAIFREYALKDSPDEKGAKERRLDAMKLDPEKGATAYLVKYLTKNIDGAQGMEKELDLESKGQQEMFVKEGQSRVEAWATCWGIRQFQFIGGPSVSVWRELRRVDDEQIEEMQALLPEAETMRDSEQACLQQIKEAADAADWAAFVLAMGGPTLKRAEYPLQSWRVPNLEINDYYELLESVKGVVLSGVEEVKNIMTRFLVWTVRPIRANDQEAQSADSWTCVNNCTGSIQAGAG
ncbi:replication endonuclease [Endozoicomonas atrinae]|uniref:replication endonuclease n=1 Tax=Endozoicomonas atrinae TaxID=1333660 RepID=UPI0008240E3F|nr:replication endonuclease [Endozoicomonas atrinae]